MMRISIDILQYIIDTFLCAHTHTNARDAISLISCCRAHYDGLYVRKIMNFKLTQAAIEQRKFKYLEEMATYCEDRLMSIDHLQHLRVLYVLYISYMPDLSRLKLTSLFIGAPIIDSSALPPTLKELHVGFYNKELRISAQCPPLEVLQFSDGKHCVSGLYHLAGTLRELVCVGTECKIAQSDIDALRLTRLDTNDNRHIYSVNHMADTLRVLKCGAGEIDQDGIKDVRLHTLIAEQSGRIRSVAHTADTLRVLHVRSISQKDVEHLMLEELVVWKESDITDLNHMADTLRVLSINAPALTQAGIAHLRLRKMCIECDVPIHDLNHMASTLRELEYNGSALTQAGIAKLQLNKLVMCGRTKLVTDVNHMANTLRWLECAGDCGVDQAGIAALRLRVINVCCNNKIKSLAHMVGRLEYVTCCPDGAVSAERLPGVSYTSYHYEAWRNMIS